MIGLIPSTEHLITIKASQSLNNLSIDYIHKLLQSNAENKICLHLWFYKETLYNIVKRSEKYGRICEDVQDAQTNKAVDDLLFDFACMGEVDLIMNLLMPETENLKKEK